MLEMHRAPQHRSAWVTLLCWGSAPGAGWVLGAPPQNFQHQLLLD